MHLDALTDAGAKLWPHLPHPDGFYLAGGTALALQIGHRVSVDFDFFTSESIPLNLLAKVRRAYPDAELVPAVNDDEELTVFVDGVKVTFLSYPFPVIEPLRDISGQQVMSIQEIAATKAYTIGRRGALKDYVDLYFVIADGHATLPEVIAVAEQKFGAEFNARLFLEQLVFLDDIDDADIVFLKRSVSRQDISELFASRIADIEL